MSALPQLGSVVSAMSQPIKPRSVVSPRTCHREMMRLAIAAAVVAAALLVPRAAEACGQLTDGEPRLIVPAPGTSDVPTNVVIGVWWNEGGADGLVTDVEVRPAAGGARVDATVASQRWGILGWAFSVQITPSVPLAPMTAYDVVRTGTAAPETIVGSFMTGAGPSSDVPNSPTLIINVGDPQACTFEWCCFPEATVQLATASVDPGDVVYEIQEGATTVAWDVNAPIEFFAPCKESWVYESRVQSRPPLRLEAGTHVLSIVARSTAGLVSTPTMVTLTLDCKSSDGCTCHATGGAWNGALPIVFAAAWIIGCHRRRRTPLPRLARRRQRGD